MILKTALPYAPDMFYGTQIIRLFFILYRRKGHIYAAYADNLFLPFALLAARTFLPPAVLILALNP